jgi:tetratricopeptide (TPR) repeat protein
VTLRKLEQPKEALTCFDEALKLKPDDAEAWCSKGMALGQLGQPKEALTCFDEAVKLKHDFADAWRGKGMSLDDLGQSKEALACFDEAVNLKPDFAEAWYSKGLTLGNLGRHKEALACYDETIKLKPDLAEAWNNKGAILCDERGEFNEAIVCFDQALNLEPTLIEPRIGKSVALEKLGRVEEAKTYLREAFSLSETMPDKRFMALDYLTQFILKEGLEGIASQDMKEAEERALELVKLRNDVEKDEVAQRVHASMRQFKEGLSKRELISFKEFEEISRRFEANKP